MRLFLVLFSVVLVTSGQMMGGPMMMNGNGLMHLHMMDEKDMPMHRDAMPMMMKESTKCQDFCSSTFSPHTFVNQPDVLKSCNLGCQLASLTEMANKDLNETSVQEKCVEDCGLAYPKDEQLRSACEKGCNNQQFGITQGSVEITMDNPNQKFLDRVNGLMDSASGSMFGQMGQLMNSMMQGFHHMDINPKNIFQFPVSLKDLDKETDDIRNKFDSFFKKNPLADFFGHMGPGPMMMEQEAPKAVESDKRQLKSDPATNPLFSYANSLHSRTDAAVPDMVGGRKVAKLGAELDSSAKPVGNTGPKGRPIILVQMIPMRIHTAATDNSFVESDNADGSLELKPHEPSPPVFNIRDRSDEDSTDPDNTWIACLARQTGRLSIVSRWLLMLAMILCIVSMMWICVTIIRTAPKRRLRQQMNVDGDREYLVVCGPEEKKSTPFFVETPTYAPTGPAVLLVPPMEGAPPPYIHSPSKQPQSTA